MNKKAIIELARELRRNQTPAEKILWHQVRNRKFDGKKFLRQHPLIYENFNDKKLSFFIPDFYCAEYKLVVELDGKIHDFQKDYDEQRDFIIGEMGIRVLRIRNEEMKDIEKVKEKIRKYFNSPTGLES
ncbi:MAG: endonuclease domain-containing protein [Calditrichales bacterium]|nr:endonuclease domain-containing protein [Calditrichales bacterium]